MAHEVETQDGIVIRGIPDDVPPDSPIVKAKVAKARSERDSASVTADMSGPERFLAGVGMGMSRVGRGIGQITGLTPQSTVDEAAPRDAALSNTGAGMAGDIVGNLALTAVPGMGVGGLATKGAAAVLPATIAPTVGAAATGAAINASTVPVPTGDSRSREALIGAAGGALGDLAARGVARIAQPIMQTPEVKELLSRGIVPTPGQAAGGGMSRVEEKLTSIPLTGEIIQNARVRPRDEFNRATLNLAMPGNAKVSQAGNAGFQEVKQELGSAYDNVFRGKTVAPDSALFSAIDAAKSVPLLPLSNEGERQFNSIIANVFKQRMPASGSMDASTLKTDVIGDIGKEARSFLKSQVRSEQAVGEALMEARNTVNKWLTSEVAKSSPMAAAQIAAIDRHYGVRKQIEKAVDRSAAQGGVFTPYQALKATLPGTDARGLAETAQSVIGNRVPNSGTMDRGLMAYLAMHPSSVVNPAEYAGIPLASLMYSRPGSRYMVGDLIPGQSTIADLARRAAPATAQGGRALNEAWQNRTK